MKNPEFKQIKYVSPDASWVGKILNIAVTRGQAEDNPTQCNAGVSIVYIYW